MKKLRSLFVFVFGFVALLVVANLGTTIYSSISIGNIPPEDGMVLSMQPGTTMFGIQQVLMNAPGTTILSKSNMVILAWSVKDQGVAFVVIDTSTLRAIRDSAPFARILGLKGDLVNVKNAKELMEAFKSDGWKVITAAQLKTMLANVSKIAVADVIAGIGNSFTTFMVIPVAVFDNENLPSYEPVIQ